MTPPEPHILAAWRPKLAWLKPFSRRHSILGEEFDSSLVESEGVVKETDIFG
jgi:hypothetical protein